MISDKEKQEVADYITHGFDRWSIRYFQKFFLDLKEGKSDAYTTVYSQQRFLERRAYDIGAYMHVLKMCKQNKTIQKHRKWLIESSIRSIVKDGFASSEFDSDKKEDGTEQDKSYTRRQKQNIIHDYYKEMFFEYNPESLQDNRMSQFSSVFSDKSLPDSMVDHTVMKYLKLDYTASILNESIMERLSSNSIIRFAFPEFIEDILKFREECRNVFENLGESNEKIAFLRQELGEFSPILTTFYSHITSILSLSWFRFCSNKSRGKFFGSAYRLKLSRNDILKSNSLLISNTKSNRYTGFLLMHCGNAFMYYQKHGEAVLLFEQSENLADNELDRGMMRQNIAVAYRANENFKLMLSNMKKALKHYKKADKTYHICMAHQLIGESRWRLGLEESAMKSFDKAEEASKNMEDRERYKISFNIGMSFNRLGENRLRNRYLAKALKLIPEEETNKILEINRMISD